MGIEKLRRQRRLAGGTTRRVQPLTPLDTGQQFTEREGLQRLRSNRRAAQNLMRQAPELADDRRVREIADKGFLREVGGGLLGLLSFLDRPRKLVALGLRDIFEFDERRGVEIQGGDYLKVLQGKHRDLINRLGPEVVGKHGDIGFSTMLDGVWSNDENDAWWDKALRFGVSLAGDIVTDPLAYLTFGASTHSRKALFGVIQKNVRDAAEKAGDRILGKIGREVTDDAFEAAIHQQVKRNVQTVIRDSLDKVPASILQVYNPQVVRKLTERAVGDVVPLVAAKEGNPLIQAAANRRWGDLGDDFISHVNARGKARELPLTGGIRLTVPFGNTKWQSRSIPGTRGLGKKLISDPARKLVGEGIYQKYRRHADSFLLQIDATGTPFIIAGRRGIGSSFLGLERVAQAAKRSLDPDNASSVIARHLDNITEQAAADDLSPALLDELYAELFPSIHGGDLTAAVVHSGKYSDEMVNRFGGLYWDYKEALRSAHRELNKHVPDLARLENYVEIILSPEFKSVVDDLAGRGLLPTISLDLREAQRLADTLGVDVERLNLFAEFVQGVTRGDLRGPVKVGETPFANHRWLGQTIVPFGSDDGNLNVLMSRGFFEGADDPLIQRAFKDPKALSEAVDEVLAAWVKHRNLDVKLVRKVHGREVPIHALDFDPLRAMRTYLRSMQRAAVEHAMINEAKRIGLAQDQDFATNVDAVLYMLQPKLERSRTLVESLVGERRQAIETLNSRQIETVEVSVAGAKVGLPAPVARHPRVQAALVKMRRQGEQLNAKRGILVEQRKRESERIARDLGISADSAQTIVALDATGLNEFRAAAVQATEEYAEERQRVLVGVIAGMADTGGEMAGLVERATAQVNHIRQTTARQIDQLERTYLERAGLLSGDASLTVMRGDAIDPEATAQAVGRFVAEVQQAARRQADAIVTDLRAEHAVVTSRLRQIANNDLDEAQALLSQQELLETTIDFLGDQAAWRAAGKEAIPLDAALLEYKSVLISGLDHRITRTSPLARLLQTVNDPPLAERFNSQWADEVNNLLAIATPLKGQVQLRRVGNAIDVRIVDPSRQGPRFSIDEMAASLRAGEITPEDLQRAGLGEVVRYNELREGMRREIAAAATAKGNVTRNTRRAREGLESFEQVWDDLSAVLSGEMRPRAFLNTYRPFGAKTGRREFSEAWRRMERVMPPEEVDRMRRKLETLIASEAKPTRALIARNEALWEGRLIGTLEEARQRVQQVALGIDAELTAAAMAEHEQVIRLAEGFLEELTGLTEFAAPRRAGIEIAEHAQQRELSNGLVRTFDEQKAAVVDALRQVGKKAQKGDMLRMAKNIRKTQVERAALTGGMRPAREFGMAGALADVQIDPLLGAYLRNIAGMFKGFNTLEGMQALQGATRVVHNYWKAGATVDRPTFHVRNMVSIVANGMLIGVGARHYIKYGPAIRKFRRALNESRGNIATALDAVPQELRKGFEEASFWGIHTAGFARSDILAPRLRSRRALDMINPLSPDFLLHRTGGQAMEGIEDMARLTSFLTVYEETGNAMLARVLTLDIHFDYQNLAPLERWVKPFAPFIVWTRRNLPLQLRAVMEQPGYVNRWGHLKRNVESEFGSEEGDDFPLNPFFSGLAADASGLPGGMLNPDTDTWARLIFDPDLPVNILDEVPIFGDRSDSFLPVDPRHMLAPSEWMRFSAGLLGPLFSFVSEAQATENSDYERLAPTGFNEILRFYNAVSFWDIGETSAAGDVVVSPLTQSTLRTAVPFLPEYVAPFEQDPRRAQRLGLPQDPDAAERIRALLLSLGSGVGFRTQTPADIPSAAFDARQVLDRLRREQRRQLVNR